MKSQDPLLYFCCHSLFTCLTHSLRCIYVVTLTTLCCIYVVSLTTLCCCIYIVSLTTLCSIYVVTLTILRCIYVFTLTTFCCIFYHHNFMLRCIWYLYCILYYQTARSPLLPLWGSVNTISISPENNVRNDFVDWQRSGANVLTVQCRSLNAFHKTFRKLPAKFVKGHLLMTSTTLFCNLTSDCTNN